MSQAKTYHGLIQNNKLDPGLENEVFTLLYYVTDNTYLRLERAVLLANAQLTTAETSMYNSSRDNISNHPVTIQFNCFPIMGVQVDRAAKALLQDITGVAVNYEDTDSYKPNYEVTNNRLVYKEDNSDGLGYKSPKRASLDSNDYTYGIMNSPDPGDDKIVEGSKIDSLQDGSKYAEYGNKLLADAIKSAGTGVAGSSGSRLSNV
jgi:hypothetical protein